MPWPEVGQTCGMAAIFPPKSKGFFVREGRKKKRIIGLQGTKLRLMSWVQTFWNKPSYLSEIYFQSNAHWPGCLGRSFAANAFPTVSPTLWNDLPKEVRKAPTLLDFCKLRQNWIIKEGLIIACAGIKARQYKMVLQTCLDKWLRCVVFTSLYCVR